MHSARFRIACIAVVTGCATGPEGYVHPDVPEVPIVDNSEAREAARSSEVRIVEEKQALANGLDRIIANLKFGDDQDGTVLLKDFLERARARGAIYASDVNIYFTTQKDGADVECRIGIYPANTVVPTEVPAHTTMVSVMAPVTKTVTENEYRCRLVNKTSTRYVTKYENRCRMVSKPVTRMETTYSSHYDSFSKSMRTQPQTRSVTHYEMQNECKMEPVSNLVTENRMENECKMEPVTKTVTRYEFQLQSRFVPPHLEYVQKKKLKESEPVCYTLGDTPTKGNRLEAMIYIPTQRD